MPAGFCSLYIVSRLKARGSDYPFGADMPQKNSWRYYTRCLKYSGALQVRFSRYQQALKKIVEQSNQGIFFADI